VNYYEHHLGDYLRDTAHLSMLEDGAYRRLIDAYYIRCAPLPIAKKDCYRLVRAAKKNERESVDAILKEFFLLAEDGWHHKRCDQEIARFLDKKEKARLSAEARWNPSERNANAMRTHSERNALQSPVTSHQTPDSKKLRSGSVRSFRPSSSERGRTVLKNGVENAVATAAEAFGKVPR